MLDPVFVRDHQDEVRRGLQKRGLNVDGELEAFVTLENRRRRLIPELEGLKRDQNTAGDWTTKAQRLNGVDVIDTGIDLKPGEDVTGLEIELTNQQSQVTGTVSNSRGQVMKDYSVVVFSRDREKWNYAQTRYIKPGQPDQDGRFKVTGLPAGDYYAVALDYIDFGEMNDPEFLDRVKDRATTFSLDDGGTKVLDLKLSSST